MKNVEAVVKYCVYLDVLLMGSIYVIKSTFLEETRFQAKQTSLRAPPSIPNLHTSSVLVICTALLKILF